MPAKKRRYRKVRLQGVRPQDLAAIAREGYFSQRTENGVTLAKCGGGVRILKK